MDECKPLILGITLQHKKEYEKAVEWYTKVGWCRLPVSQPALKALFFCLRSSSPLHMVSSTNPFHNFKRTDPSLSRFTAMLKARMR